MEARFVGAADEIAHGGDGAVGNNAYFGRVNADRADISGLAAQEAFDFSIGGKPEGIKPRQLACLDLVESVVAAQQ